MKTKNRIISRIVLRTYTYAYLVLVPLTLYVDEVSHFVVFEDILTVSESVCGGTADSVHYPAPKTCLRGALPVVLWERVRPR